MSVLVESLNLPLGHSVAECLLACLEMQSPRVDTPQQNTCSMRCPTVLPIDKPDMVIPSALPQVVALVVEFSPSPQERILIGNNQFVMATVDDIILLR